ncbi:peptidylprolyl isomerase [Luteolibacter sp. AS25]|uniref:peptidylprolyl isomerase n=1 Tax=Luteolibacter sp. AS25 TaxID=3135776 RepID=UPI00398A7A69
MRTFTKFSLRFGVYLLVLAYVAGDLFVFDGPLKKQIGSKDPNSAEAIAEAKANGVVARVFNRQITRSQLDYAINEHLWTSGRSISDIINPEEKTLLTYAALGELIDHELLRVKVKVNTAELPVSKQEVDARLKTFIGKFESRHAIETAMISQGIPNEESLRNRIAARIQQEKYIALRVDPLVAVTEEEVQNFFEAHKPELVVPERVMAQHIFISTLNTPSPIAKQRLETALAALETGETDFSTMALELSEDTATNENQGNLGWMSKERLPSDFGEQLFALGVNKPTLIRTKIGWHLAILKERKNSRILTLDEAREKITEALISAKRHKAVMDFKRALRKFEEHKIDIFHDQLVAY